MRVKCARPNCAKLRQFAPICANLHHRQSTAKQQASSNHQRHAHRKRSILVRKVSLLKLVREKHFFFVFGEKVSSFFCRKSQQSPKSNPFLLLLIFIFIFIFLFFSFSSAKSARLSCGGKINKFNSFALINSCGAQQSLFFFFFFSSTNEHHRRETVIESNNRQLETETESGKRAEQHLPE